MKYIIVIIIFIIINDNNNNTYKYNYHFNYNNFKFQFCPPNILKPVETVGCNVMHCPIEGAISPTTWHLGLSDGHNLSGRLWERPCPG